jgi:hypothetical protein
MSSPRGVADVGGTGLEPLVGWRVKAERDEPVVEWRWWAVPGSNQ